jgi:hypothetical protein
LYDCIIKVKKGYLVNQNGDNPGSGCLEEFDVAGRDVAARVGEEVDEAVRDFLGQNPDDGPLVGGFGIEIN